MTDNAGKTKYSYMSDEEYLGHLYSKQEATVEDLESATRIEMLLNDYAALVTCIADLAEQALGSAVDGGDYRAAILRIREVVHPTQDETPPTLQ